MVSLPLYDLSGKKVETIDVKDEIFDGQVNSSLLHQTVVMYAANKRQGTASAKDRSEARGGGSKPWRQKGTGRARAGSIRSPLWKGGGVTFGPKPRDYSYNLPKKMRLIALKSSINAKINSRDLVMIEKVELGEFKTKEFKKLLESLKIKEKALLIAELRDPSIIKASRNISFFNIVRPKQVNAYDILRHKKVIITKSALKDLIKRVNY